MPDQPIAGRTLTDADVEAIVDKLGTQFSDNFFQYLGKGFWGLIKKGLWLMFGGVALYGMSKGIR